MSIETNFAYQISSYSFGENKLSTEDTCLTFSLMHPFYLTFHVIYAGMEIFLCKKKFPFFCGS